MKYLLLQRNQLSGLEAMDFNINNGKYLICMEEWKNAILDRRGGEILSVQTFKRNIFFSFSHNIIDSLR